MTLALTLDLQGQGTLTKDDTVAVVSDPFLIGSTGMPSMRKDVADGASGANKANVWYRSRQTINATTNLDLDLAGGITDPFGATITGLYVRAILIQVISPDGVKKVTVGPGGASNPFLGPFVGTTPSIDVFNEFYINHLSGTNGWTITAGTGDILRVRNPGGSAVDVNIFLLLQK